MEGQLKQVKAMIDDYLILLADTRRTLRRKSTIPDEMIFQRDHKNDPQEIQAIIDHLEKLYEMIDGFHRGEEYKEV